MLRRMLQALCVSAEGLDNWNVNTEVYSHISVFGIMLRGLCRVSVVRSDVRACLHVCQVKQVVLRNVDLIRIGIRFVWLLVRISVVHVFIVELE